MAPGVRLIYGVRPAKRKRRQRTAAAQASQATRARAANTSRSRPADAGAAAPGAAGLPGAAGQPLKFSRRSGVTPGHDDSFIGLSFEPRAVRPPGSAAAVVPGHRGPGTGLNAGAHAVQACTIPFSAGRDRPRLAGYLPTYGPHYTE